MSLHEEIDKTEMVQSATKAEITKLEENEYAVNIRSAIKGGDDWGEFVIAAGAFDPLKGFKAKRKPLSEEQKRAVAERLAAARNS